MENPHSLLGDASSNGCSAIVMLVFGWCYSCLHFGSHVRSSELSRFSLVMLVFITKYVKWNWSGSLQLLHPRHCPNFHWNFAKTKTRWAVLYLGVLTTAFTNWLQTIGQQLEVETHDEMWRIHTDFTKNWMGYRFFGNYVGSSFHQLIVHLSWSFRWCETGNIIVWFFYIWHMCIYIYVWSCMPCTLSFPFMSVNVWWLWPLKGGSFMAKLATLVASSWKRRFFRQTGLWVPRLELCIGSGASLRWSLALRPLFFGGEGLRLWSSA